MSYSTDIRAPLTTRAFQRAQAVPAVVSAYPLVRPLAVAGVFAGVAVLLVYQDMVAAIAFVTLFLLVGLTWHRNQLPAVPFCLGFQWVAAVSGYLFRMIVGHYPKHDPVGDLETAVLYAMCGLLCLAIGIRLVLGQVDRVASRKPGIKTYRIPVVFAWVIALFSFNWMVEVIPRNIAPEAAEILKNVLLIRYLALFVLLTSVSEQRRRYGYAAVAVLFVIAPEVLTGHAKFKEVMFVVGIAVLQNWRPWERNSNQAQVAPKVAVCMAILSVLMIGLGLVWNGSVKAQWRQVVWSQGFGGSPAEKLATFVEILSEVPETFDLATASEGLVSRLSSGTNYFSHVLQLVPDHIDHERGALLNRTIQHITMPRFLYPDKQSLGGDSWLVQRYAGHHVAGDERGTSVGLGYMAEFYIDFGLLGVVVMALCYGLFIGICLLAAAYAAPSAHLFKALMAALLTQHVMSFDGNFTKLVGGLAQATIILGIGVKLIGPILHNFFAAARPRR